MFLSDLLSNCYFVMSCVSLLKKRAESNLGAGSISICFLFLVDLGGAGREPPRVSNVGEGGELVLELWPPARNEGVAAYSLLGLGGGHGVSESHGRMGVYPPGMIRTVLHP